MRLTPGVEPGNTARRPQQTNLGIGSFGAKERQFLRCLSRCTNSAGGIALENQCSEQVDVSIDAELMPQPGTHFSRSAR